MQRFHVLRYCRLALISSIVVVGLTMFATSGIVPGRGLAPAAAQTVQLLSKEGWLEVERLQGYVTIQTSAERPAKTGDRLTKSGDVITTGQRASTSLKVDHRIGTIQMAQNTRLKVRQLGVLRSGGWITTVNLERGQARMRVDKKSMPRGSVFEVHSPSGVAGVRGTDFSTMVNPANRMVVGTQTGLVEAQHQGKSVDIKPDFGSALFPEQPPLPPLPIDSKLELDLEEATLYLDSLWVRGSIHPLNTIFVNGVELNVDAAGKFDQSVPIFNTGRIPITVSNVRREARNYPLFGMREGYFFLGPEEAP